MKQILVTIPVEERHKRKLEEAAGNKAVLSYKGVSEVGKEDMKEIHGLIGNLKPDMLGYAEHLEWVQLHSAGDDKYRAPGVLPEGCILQNAVGAYGRSVSEHMIALTFALIRKFPQYIRNQAENLWKDEGTVISVEGSTVLVLGLGDIGGSYARKMKALGAYVIGVRKSLKEKPEYLDEQYSVDQLSNIIGRADIIASALPSSPDTVGLFDKEMFLCCKRGAYLINGGRGNAVVTEDLIEAVHNGIISGAGLDVTDPEPLPANHRMWQEPNILITPHVAGGFHLAHTFERIVELTCIHMHKWLNE